VNVVMNILVPWLIIWFVACLVVWLLVSAPVGMYMLSKFISDIPHNSLNTSSHIL
jgi:hypothetical protein